MLPTRQPNSEEKGTKTDSPLQALIQSLKASLERLKAQSAEDSEEDWSDSEEESKAIAPPQKNPLQDEVRTLKAKATRLQNQLNVMEVEKLIHETQLKITQQDKQLLLQDQQTSQSNIQSLTSELQQAKTAIHEIRNEFITLQEKNKVSDWRIWLTTSLFSLFGSAAGITAKLLVITTLSILSGPIGWGIFALGIAIGVGCAYKARQNYVASQEQDAVLKKVQALDNNTQARETPVVAVNQFINQLHQATLSNQPISTPSITTGSTFSSFIPAKKSVAAPKNNSDLDCGNRTFSPR